VPKPTKWFSRLPFKTRTSNTYVFPRAACLSPSFDNTDSRRWNLQIMCHPWRSSMR